MFSIRCINRVFLCKLKWKCIYGTVWKRLYCSLLIPLIFFHAIFPSLRIAARISILNENFFLTVDHPFSLQMSSSQGQSVLMEFGLRQLHGIRQLGLPVVGHRWNPIASRKFHKVSIYIYPTLLIKPIFLSIVFRRFAVQSLNRRSIIIIKKLQISYRG